MLDVRVQYGSTAYHLTVIKSTPGPCALGQESNQQPLVHGATSNQQSHTDQGANRILKFSSNLFEIRSVKGITTSILTKDLEGNMT